MREYAGTGKVYNSYILDDGWNVPKEVIEVINLRIEMAYTEALSLVRKQKSQHQGLWITESIARQYEQAAWPYLMVNGGQYTGYVRDMGTELQDVYGVTEVEAMNILNGLNIKDYVHKYHCIKNLIPLNFSGQDVCDEVLVEYGYLSGVV